MQCSKLYYLNKQQEVNSVHILCFYETKTQSAGTPRSAISSEQQANILSCLHV